HAVAIGAFYRPNENTLVNIGTTMGDAANMFNAGVSVKLGQGSGLPISRTAMAREIQSLKQDNQGLRDQMEVMQERDAEREQKMQMILQQLEELRKAQAAR
ncbi:MAG: hypothetical protein HXL71_06940, partial [Dialister invisus]|nr:hypothetical protein [Dialister invisus]